MTFVKREYLISLSSRRLNRAALRIYLVVACSLLGLIVSPSAIAQNNSNDRLPLYIVNGKELSASEVKAIDPKDIEDNILLPADEQTIAKYGAKANNGVVIITLKYDTPARFAPDGKEQNYTHYIAQRVIWDETDPIARVVIKFSVDSLGMVGELDVMEATDRRMLRRIEKAIEEAPRWQAAMKDGKGIKSEHILRLTLPIGSKMPRQRAIAW